MANGLMTANSVKKAWAKTAHAKALAPPAPMVMLDATAKVTVPHVKARAKDKDHAATQAKARAMATDKAADRVRRVKAVHAAIAPLVKTAVRAVSPRTMISNPAPMPTWAHKAASMRLATNHTVAMARANLTPLAPAST